MVQNILNWYAVSTPQDRTEGLSWYREANKLLEIMAVNGQPDWKNAAVISAFSTNTSWNRNKQCALNWAHGEQVGHLKDVLNKVDRIEQAEILEECLAILNGKKLRAFCLNILGYWDHVTVDRWAARVAGTDKYKTAKQYQVVAEAYIESADILELKPAVLQAITWITIRKAEKKEHYG